MEVASNFIQPVTLVKKILIYVFSYEFRKTFQDNYYYIEYLCAANPENIFMKIVQSLFFGSAE